jgi:hypothetical protein
LTDGVECWDQYSRVWATVLEGCWGFIPVAVLVQVLAGAREGRELTWLSLLVCRVRIAVWSIVYMGLGLQIGFIGSRFRFRFIFKLQTKRGPSGLHTGSNAVGRLRLGRHNIVLISCSSMCPSRLSWLPV